MWNTVARELHRRQLLLRTLFVWKCHVGVPLRGTKISMVYYKSINSLLDHEELKHIKKSYLFWDKEYLDEKISKKLIDMFLA